MGVESLVRQGFQKMLFKYMMIDIRGVFCVFCGLSIVREWFYEQNRKESAEDD